MSFLLVIPAKAGIQLFTGHELDPGLTSSAVNGRRDDGQAFPNRFS
jgi:hypothetical protein